MRFSQVAIEALAYAAPPTVWTSAAIEEQLRPTYERLRLPAGRLELMTGIRERRFWPTAVRPSWASAEAGRALLAQTRFAPGDFEALAHAAVCRDQLEPATAAAVHHALGLPPTAQIFDLSNACLGFLNALVLFGGMVEGGVVRRALACAGEDGRPLLERTLRLLAEPHHTRQTIKPFFANLTIGAGAVAASICHTALAPEAPRLLAATVETDTSAAELCQGGAAGDELHMETDSEQLLEAGLACASRCWTRFQAETGWTAATPDVVVCHQVGRTHQRRLFKTLGLDEAKDFSTFPEWGNVGSVAAPLTLAKAVEAGALRRGMKVAVLGIGSGLSSLMLALQW